MLTLGTAAAMLLAQPLAAGRLGCGSQPWQIMLVCYLRILVLQLVNGLAVMVKIAWAFSFKGFLTWGVSSHQQGSVLFDRALLLWAACLTFIFSALTLLLQRWRGWLELSAAASDGAARAASRGANAAAGADATAGADADADADADSGRRRGMTAHCLGLKAYCPGLDWRAMCVQYLLLLEATFGWVTGCAWTDALVAYTPLGENTIERPWVAAEDLLVASAFTALGVLWLVSTGQAVGASAAVVHHARAHAEAAFATNALCFFVGWSWVVVLRDGTALVFLALARHVASLGETVSSRNETLAVQGFVAELGFVAEGCTAFLLGPGLTVAALWAAHVIICAILAAPRLAAHTGLLAPPSVGSEVSVGSGLHSGDAEPRSSLPEAGGSAAS